MNIQLLSFWLALLLCIGFAWSEDDEINVPLKFGESELTLSFPANHAAASTMARKFCTEKVMSDDNQLNSCLDTVGSYLKTSVDSHIRKRSKPVERPPQVEQDVLTITLKIGQTVYNIIYKYEDQSAMDVASVFCKENMDALQLTLSSLTTCVHPVVDQLDTALERHLSSKGKPVPAKKVADRTVTLDIGGTFYDLVINKSKESVEESAARFCMSKLEEFELDSDNMRELCADPIVEYVNTIVN